VQTPAALPLVSADVRFLGHVIDNLLDNALKFSPQDGQVELHARIEADEVVITVRDHGIGIPPDKLKQVFERFFQVNGTTTRPFGGMGIGLSLCQRIVEAHDGRIWAESAGEGCGSTFCFALQALGAEEAAPEAVAEAD
jgi:signal transduction histidine kinase